MALKNQFNRPPENKALVRFCTPGDFEKITHYYKDNTHHHVHVRDPEWIARHVRKGQFLLIERPDGEIIAASATYDYHTAADSLDGAPSYYEIGSTNFKQPGGRGYDLYPFMIAAQVIDAFLRYPPKKCFIANVYDSSPVGRTMLKPIVGWQIVTPEQDVLKKFNQSKSANNQSAGPMSWYGATSSTLPHQARIVLEYLTRGEVIHKKTGEKLTLDFSRFSLATSERKLVEQLASGHFGNMIEDNADFPLQQARALLAHYNKGTISPYKPEL